MLMEDVHHADLLLSIFLKAKAVSLMGVYNTLLEAVLNVKVVINYFTTVVNYQIASFHKMVNVYNVIQILFSTQKVFVSQKINFVINWTKMESVLNV